MAVDAAAQGRGRVSAAPAATGRPAGNPSSLGRGREVAGQRPARAAAAPAWTRPGRARRPPPRPTGPRSGHTAGWRGIAWLRMDLTVSRARIQSLGCSAQRASRYTSVRSARSRRAASGHAGTSGLASRPGHEHRAPVGAQGPGGAAVGPQQGGAQGQALRRRQHQAVHLPGQPDRYRQRARACTPRGHKRSPRPTSGRDHSRRNQPAPTSPGNRRRPATGPGPRYRSPPPWPSWSPGPAQGAGHPIGAHLVSTR